MIADHIHCHPLNSSGWNLVFIVDFYIQSNAAIVLSICVCVRCFVFALSYFSTREAEFLFQWLAKYCNRPIDDDSTHKHTWQSLRVYNAM